jgi:hypothetical protein
MTKNAAPAAPAFLSDRPRFRVIDLEWPLAYAGKDYRAITIVRMTAADIEAYTEKLAELAKTDPNARFRLPVYRDEAGAPVPDAVLDALDDDDRLAVDTAALDFFPRRFLSLEADATPQPSGGTIAP